jgi:UDP-N-acetylmuramate dehydrogenase
MDIQKDIPLKGKTTMRIGGNAAFYADLLTKEDVDEAVAFAKEKSIPLIVLGGGSNTIFADGTINALVVRIAASGVVKTNNTVTVDAAKNLPILINELAKEGLDLSPLTGILGTVGGAVYGNAGQGPKGIWIDEYVLSVDVYVNGKWETKTQEECDYRYRESWFKDQSLLPTPNPQPPIIWSVTLRLPEIAPEEITAEIQTLLQKRLDTQPHIKTAGSCFKAVGGKPAWQLIDEAGLRKTTSGGVHISEKHANFLINDGEATFEDATKVVKTIDDAIPEGLEVEMRFVKEDGTLLF